jgi:hypothetical protein
MDSLVRPILLVDSFRQKEQYLRVPVDRPVVIRVIGLYMLMKIFFDKRISGYSRSWLIVNYTFHAGSVEGVAIGELTFHHTDGCVQPFVSLFVCVD